jgi:hypothetical protein
MHSTYYVEYEEGWRMENVYRLKGHKKITIRYIFPFPRMDDLHYIKEKLNRKFYK